jgi:hypothetical protein
MSVIFVVAGGDAWFAMSSWCTWYAATAMMKEKLQLCYSENRYKRLFDQCFLN